MIFDIEFGKDRGVIGISRIPSGWRYRPMPAFWRRPAPNIRLLQFPSGEIHKVLLRSSLSVAGEKPRPSFLSPDGKTVFVWDHRPIAYDVETGQEKWKANSRTIHTVRMDMCDVSPDGASLLIRHGHGVSLFDAATGAERNVTEAPALPSGIVWSPDGTKIFTRVERHDRTWTAWNASTGARLFDLQPTGFTQDDDWKLLPDMFFISGGREIVVGLEKRESTEGAGPKELLVFDTSTGRPLRRLGKPLPKDIFQWMYPSPSIRRKSVLMQMYAISPPGTRHADSIRTECGVFLQEHPLDPVAQVSRQNFVHGDRTDSPGIIPYYVTTREVLLHAARRIEPESAGENRCYPGSGLVRVESTATGGSRISDDFLLALATTASGTPATLLGSSNSTW